MNDSAPHAARPLILVAAIFGGLFVFAIAASFAVGGAPHAFDRAVLLAMREAGDPAAPAGPAWIEAASRDVTMLGGTPFLTMLTIAVAGFFIVRRKAAPLAILIAAVIGETLIVSQLKALFGRARPDIIPHFVEATSGSFPSGHSASAAAIFLTLAALLARELKERSLRRYIFSVAIILALAVGSSRIYLGVHYPTDVIGGLAFGTAWAALVFYAARRFEIKR